MRTRPALIIVALVIVCAPMALSSGPAGAATTQDPPLPPACDDYTPDVMTVRPASVNPGETVLVEGTAAPGTTIEVTLSPPPGTAGSIVGPISTTVGADSRWSVTVSVPADAGGGAWVITARDVQCQTQNTAEVRVLSDSTGTGTTPTTPASQGSQPAASPASNLAVTGTAMQIPLSIGFLLLTLGGLLLLQRGRSHERMA